MTTFAKGDAVKQKVPVITGTVAGFQIDQQTGERLILVEWPDADGNNQQRYFNESDLEADPGRPAAAPVAAEEMAVSAEASAG